MTPLKYRLFFAGWSAATLLALAAWGAEVPPPRPKPSTPVAVPKPTANVPAPKPPPLANPRWSPLYDYESLDVKPRPLVQEAPLFPPGLKEKGAKAKVMVEFIIGKLGNVEAAQVLSSTDPRFNEVCVAAALKWRFTVPKKQSEAVYCRAAQNLSFD